MVQRPRRQPFQVSAGSGQVDPLPDPCPSSEQVEGPGRGKGGRRSFRAAPVGSWPDRPGSRVGVSSAHYFRLCFCPRCTDKSERSTSERDGVRKAKKKLGEEADRV